MMRSQSVQPCQRHMIGLPRVRIAMFALRKTAGNFHEVKPLGRHEQHDDAAKSVQRDEPRRPRQPIPNPLVWWSCRHIEVSRLTVNFKFRDRILMSQTSPTQMAPKMGQGCDSLLNCMDRPQPTARLLANHSQPNSC